MTKRLAVAPAPEPLEAYAQHFDPVFGKSNQREEFRRYLEGLLLPSERHKTLTGLVNTEPVVGAQLPVLATWHICSEKSRGKSDSACLHSLQVDVQPR